MRIEPSNVRKKSKGTTKCEKKKLSRIMLELHNMKMEPSSVRKKKREPPNVTKELSYVILESHNMRIEPSNVRKKSKGTTKCEKKNCHM